MGICVHPSGRFLMWEDGTPYYPVADTAWTLPERLSEAEVEDYARCRHEQGFNTVLICSFSELDGLRVPNRYGEFPFEGMDPTRPAEAYWRRLDTFLQMFWERGMVVGLLPTWGDKFNQKAGDGPEIFTPDNAEIYGAWLGERYRDAERLFWVLGGDRPLENDVHRQIIRRMAAGLRSRDPHHLLTFHPPGATSSTDFLPHEPWLDFHSMQSGHGLECWDSPQMLADTLATERKPAWDMECRYEDFPVCFDETTGEVWQAADVRWNIYRNMMAGACGQSYGHRYVWRFERQGEEALWRAALTRPGALQQRIAASVRMRGDYFSFRPEPELLCATGTGEKAPCAARNDGWAFVYTPCGDPVTVDLSGLPSAGLSARWLDPRTGEEGAAFSLLPARQTLTPPVSGDDWVLTVTWDAV